MTMAKVKAMAKGGSPVKMSAKMEQKEDVSKSKMTKKTAGASMTSTKKFQKMDNKKKYGSAEKAMKNL